MVFFLPLFAMSQCALNHCTCGSGLFQKSEWDYQTYSWDFKDVQLGPLLPSWKRQRCHRSTNQDRLGAREYGAEICLSVPTVRTSSCLRGTCWACLSFFLRRNVRWKVVCVFLQQLCLGAAWTEPLNISSTTGVWSEGKILKLQPEDRGEI